MSNHQKLCVLHSYAYLRMCVYVWKSKYTVRLCMGMYTHGCIHTYMCVLRVGACITYMCVCVLCMYVYKHVCLCVHKCVCMCDIQAGAISTYVNHVCPPDVLVYVPSVLNDQPYCIPQLCPFPMSSTLLYWHSWYLMAK